jgi:hypothetical protein
MSAGRVELPPGDPAGVTRVRIRDPHFAHADSAEQREGLAACVAKRPARS